MRRILLLALVLLLCAACDAPAPQVTESPVPNRTALTAEQLFSSDSNELIAVENRYFLPLDESATAPHEFNGVLKIAGHAMNTQPAVIEPAELAGKQTRLFPSVALGFVSHEGALIPTDRDILEGDGDSFWQISVEPGQTRSEPGDRGYSRASFPFMLTSNIENETYHGLATFLYNDEGVSGLAYQLVHQLTPFMVQTWFSASGLAEMKKLPLEQDPVALIAEYKAELNDRLAWHSWQELEQRFGKETMADFNSGIDPADTVISGLVMDGEIYLHTADTPQGHYPYPQGMRLGIWSASKTVGGLVALMRMAQKYGDEVLDYRITDYLEDTSNHDGWENVKFRDALNMATGIGTGTNDVSPNMISVDYIASDVDEYVAWYMVPGLQDKLDYVFDSPSYPWGPGEHVRYRDRDTFVLAAALETLLQQREGEQAELWPMLEEEVFRPIGVHHLPSTGTKDAGRAMVPFLGWGIYATVDDLAKVARLLQHKGEHNGQQLLSRAGIAEALYESGPHGLPTGASNEFGDKTYHLSLWHENFTDAEGDTYTVPKMVGWGGVVVQLMPNGLIGFRIGNGGSPGAENMARIADAIRPFRSYQRDGKNRP